MHLIIITCLNCIKEKSLMRGHNDSNCFVHDLNFHISFHEYGIEKNCVNVIPEKSYLQFCLVITSGIFIAAGLR